MSEIRFNVKGKMDKSLRRLVESGYFSSLNDLAKHALVEYLVKLPLLENTQGEKR